MHRNVAIILLVHKYNLYIYNHRKKPKLQFTSINIILSVIDNLTISLILNNR